jgi:hypothetical protein
MEMGFSLMHNGKIIELLAGMKKEYFRLRKS